MDNDIEPTIGSWYHDLANDDVFQVVATDEDEGTVELQFFTGDIEEMSINEWRGLDLEVTDPPEDWTGPVDSIEREDLDYSEVRSEGERRGLAEERRSAELQGWDVDRGTTSDWRPEDEAGSSRSRDGSGQARRNTGYRLRGDDNE